MKRRSADALLDRAFTLLELLVVVALIAGLAALLIGKLSGGSQSTALSSAQASVANMIAAARTRAIASGESVRVLLQIDPSSTEPPLRFLRLIAIAVSSNGQWHPVSSIYLPDGVFVIPGNAFTAAGLFPSSAAAAWVDHDGTPLCSTVFQSGNVCPASIDSATAEQYAFFSIAAAGTTAQSGQIVLGVGRIRARGSYAVGDSPIELLSADAVRGLKLSQYGVTTLIADRLSF